MIFNANPFQDLLNSSIQKDIISSMNPQIRAKHSAVPVIERYIQTIPFINAPPSNYSINAYADYQTVKEHFCSFWKRELGLSYADIVELEKVFDRTPTTISQFTSNSPYIILNDKRVISVQGMENALFDTLALKH